MKTLLSLAALACSITLCAAPPSAIALTNARIVTVSGPTIAKGAVVIRDGLIADVGANVTIPPDAWVIDAQGLTVYPGLIDALSTWGIPPAAPAAAAPAASRISVAPQGGGRRGGGAAAAEPVVHGPEERPATHSWVRAADLVSPADPRVAMARNAGFTSAVSFPAAGIFAGQGAFINLSADQRTMVVSSPAGQYLSMSAGGAGGFSRGYPGSLMGVIAYIRQLYLDAGHYQLERAAYAKNHTARRPNYDRAVEGLLESPRALLPAGRAYELDRMARFAAELKLNAVLYGAHEAWRDAEALKQFGYPVLVSLKWPERPRDADPDAPETLRTLELRELAPSTPAALQKAGVRFAFYSDGAAPRDAVRAVKRALDAGLAPTDAIRAMTLGAAEIYGLADRTGSIDQGKIANLVVTQGDLFQNSTQVKHIFIDGVKFEPGPDPPAGRAGGGAAPAAEPAPADNPPANLGGAR